MAEAAGTNGDTHDAPATPNGTSEETSSASHEPSQSTGTEQKDSEAQSNEDEQHEEKHDGPAGGLDKTPIPRPPTGTVGYNLRFTFHEATSLAMGDARVFSSDPYVLAQLNTGLPQRHKEDPYLRFRTKTIHRSTDPEWNEEWIVANVPSSGFKLKLRIYDEDVSDHDDLLGKVHISIPSIGDDWEGPHKEPYKLQLGQSSKRALMVRSAARALRIVHEMRGEVYVSIENLGRTGDDDQRGKAYTLGPSRWVRHYSPILGRIANIKEPDEDETPRNTTTDGKSNRKAERFNFQANQMQLHGPVPAQLYHRFVEFKPWVKRMFTKGGLQGYVLGKALHHQHTRVYNFGRSTEWGRLPAEPCQETTQKFLDLVHYDAGGRIFTYVLTLDALWRFTETGKEFGIDMLSKHTMHSDVSIYIAFSGEFFIRRLKHKHRPPPPDPTDSSNLESTPEKDTGETEPSQDSEEARNYQSHEPGAEHSQDHQSHDHHTGQSQDDPPHDHDPSRYELVIDNDSGTYRPDASMLPVLHRYLSSCLPGLHILTLDCQADADKMAKMKAEQRERKKKEGDNIVYAQVSDSSSISSSEDEKLDDVQKGYDKSNASPEKEHKLTTVANDVKQHQGARLEKFVRNSLRKPREGQDGDET